VTPALKTAPWQLWVVDFGIPVGHEQGGVRPAIVVGSVRHCGLAIDLMLVVPLTTRDRGLRHHVRIASKSSGLRYQSWARTEEIRVIPTARLIQSTPIGVASAKEIAQLRTWLSTMVAFWPGSE
jgi:mRNA interferase MazF